MSYENARRQRIAKQRSARKDLASRMRPYDRLSSKSHILPGDIKTRDIQTIHDLLQNLDISNTARGRTRRRSKTSQVLDEIRVSDQVRAAWQTKLNPNLVTLTDEMRQKLADEVINKKIVVQYDELKLIAMITAILRTWRPVNKLV